MTRRQSIIAGYAITIIVALFVLMCINTCTPSKKAQQEPEKEGIMIDGHTVEVVYDDYGMAYLKYVIGPMKYIYIPIPPEAELPDSTDSLKFYYTKINNNGKKIDNKRKID